MELFVSSRWELKPFFREFSALFVWQIYEGKSWDVNTEPVYATGASQRPFFVSAGNNITLLFRTGTNIRAQYIGFRASYYFVSSMSRNFI